MELLLLDTHKTAFQMRYLTHKWTELGYFFLKSRSNNKILKSNKGKRGLNEVPSTSSQAVKQIEVVKK